MGFHFELFSDYLVVMVMQPCEYTENVCFKIVNFMVWSYIAIMKRKSQSQEAKIEKSVWRASNWFYRMAVKMASLPLLSQPTNLVGLLRMADVLCTQVLWEAVRDTTRKGLWEGRLVAGTPGTDCGSLKKLYHSTACSPDSVEWSDAKAHLAHLWSSWTSASLQPGFQ